MSVPIFTTDTVLTPETIAAGATELGIDLQADQLAQLLGFAQLLRRWNATFNLTALERPEQVLTHHLFDCLAIVPALESLAPPLTPHILDVGSGAGLPGLVLAIARPQWRVVLIDKVGKKTAFLTQAKIDLGLSNVEVVHGRVEALTREPKFDLIVSRAFSSLVAFVALTNHLISRSGYWAAMKGAEEEETADLNSAHLALLVKVVRLRVPQLVAQRQLVVLRPLIASSAALC